MSLKESLIEKRKLLIDALPNDSYAILTANINYPTNADHHIYIFNKDLYSFTGITQEDTHLIISKDKYGITNEILFIKQFSKTEIIWDGKKLDLEDATHISGIKDVKWSNNFFNYIHNSINEFENIYLNWNEHLRNKIFNIENGNTFLLRELKSRYPLHNYKRLAPTIQYIRSIKTNYEIEMIKKACEITEKAYEKIIPYIKPNEIEKKLATRMEFEIKMMGGDGFAYNPIFASGQNSCYLHYVTNNDICKENDIILIDAAANYNYYASDCTRCFPISGKFSNRQQEVYNSVKFVLKEASKLLKPKTIIKEYQEKVEKIVESELLKLGLITNEDIKKQEKDFPAYKKYFMHGASHFIGLEVHDDGFFKKPLEKNMVLTCEPGIYIPEEKIGIRLENCYLITENEAENLMENWND